MQSRSEQCTGSPKNISRTRGLRKLEAAGYVAIDKSFLHRKPLTRARLSKAGRKAFADYLAVVAKLLDSNTPARNR